MAGEARYVLRRADNATLTLPVDAMVTSGDGETLSYSLIRAVEATEWEVEGDGEAQPAPLVLTMTFIGSTEAEASALAQAAWAFAKTAVRIERDARVFRSIAKPGSFIVTHQEGSDATSHTATLTLLPGESAWRSLSDSTPRPF